MEFTIIEGPVGMDIFDGMITWIPSESQVGSHILIVSLSDGYETRYEEFEVVTEPDEKSSPIVLIIIIIIVILVLIEVGVGVFLYIQN